MFGRHRPEEVAPCPFTDAERTELEQSGELLVYVPAGMSPAELCDTLDTKVPELLSHSAKAARRTYEDEGLHGLDLRRYLCFCAAFRSRFGTLPDQAYWTFLLSGAYDRSGVSVVGFDTWGNLSHHGWMRNFHATFCGSRYAVLAPGIEVLPQTEGLMRARRGENGARGGAEAGLDRC